MNGKGSLWFYDAMKGGNGWQGGLADGAVVKLVPDVVARTYRRPTGRMATAVGDYLVLVEVVSATPDDRGLPLPGDFLWMAEWDLVAK
jgi:hypothetical protein